MKIDKIEFRLQDCVEYMKGLEDNAFELAIVDPPYGINMMDSDNKSRGKLAKAKDYKKIDDSNAPSPNYFSELKRVSKNQIIWGANHFIGNIAKSLPKLNSLNSPCWVVWDKNNGNNDFADCELAYTSFESAVRKIQLTWNGMLQHDMKNKEHRIHPTQKPVKLYEWLLKNYANDGDKILDTHLGSGSIAIACDKMGFELVGCEIDEDYYNASIERFRKYKSQLTLF